ncbi:unnamed protein product [marine sediment metagenome]|uniref:Uncharacterized protein n=1 Tax=marine sediment metagenome TaxID=412755 RepID=X1PMV0_9ZZZZ
MRFEINWLIRGQKGDRKMQKLGERNTYTPTNASQVRSSVVVSLNREETLGEHDLKTCPNNLDGNQLSGKREQGLRVPVLNMTVTTIYA